MGGGGRGEEAEPYLQYGSPYGGARMTALSQPQISINMKRDRRPTENVEANEDIELRFKQRIINDILQRLLNPEELNRFEDIKPSEKTYSQLSNYPYV